VNDPSYPARVFYSPNVEEMAKNFSSDELLKYLKKLREESTPRFGMGPLKWIADGSIQGFTGKLKWPGYCAGDDHGFLILSEDEVVEKVLPYHEAGFQLAIHTNGDEATATVLRALERVLEKVTRFDHRHRLEHCQMASRAMMRKMSNLGIGANLFTNHVYYWGDIHRTRTIGADKARRMDAAATALREGVAISLHSDHPVTPVGPLFSMWCAVNRVTRSGHVLGVGERITALEALTAVTLGSAYLLKRDEDLGSIEVGKFADFTVLKENPLTVEPLHLKDIDVVTTVVAGVPRDDETRVSTVG
jgi:predicted amidohydrolase YtcJ